MSYLEIFYGLTEQEREMVEDYIIQFHKINKPKENRKATLKYLLMLYRHTPPSNTRQHGDPRQHELGELEMQYEKDARPFKSRKAEGGIH